MKGVLILFLIWSSPLLAQTAADTAAGEKSEEHSETGWNYYYFAMYPEAEKEFQQAVAADPENQKARMAYAKTLMKTEKLDQALAVLQESAESEETKYLTGLIYYQQSDFSAAEEYLRPLSEAGGSFSQTAGNYLSAIQNKKKRLSLVASSGIIYDSHIIEEGALDIDDLGGPRAYFSGEAGYRLLGGGKNSWSVLGEVQSIYSFDDNYSISDPLRIALHLPYVNRAKKIGENQIYLAPGFEHIRVDLAGDGSKEAFSSAFLLNYLATKKTSETAVRVWSLSFAWSQAESESLTGFSDISGPSLEVKYDRYWFFNNLQSHGMNFGLLLDLNYAEGDNIKYGRAGTNLSYFFPFFWSTQGALLATYRYTYYPVHSFARADGELILGTRFTKPVNEWLRVDFSVFNNSNDSTLESRTYDRLVGSLVATGRWTY